MLSPIFCLYIYIYMLGFETLDTLLCQTEIISLEMAESIVSVFE